MKITAGLTAKKVFTLADYSADDGWAVSGTLADGTNTYVLAAELFDGDGTEWTLTIPLATTTDYAAGDYTLYLTATKDSSPETAFESSAQVVALGTVSHARKMVTALKALMEGASTKDYSSLSTPEGESITRLTPEERIDWLTHYRKELAKEQRAATGAGGVGNVQMRFSE
jgi:hypothetical protein